MDGAMVTSEVPGDWRDSLTPSARSMADKNEKSVWRQESNQGGFTHSEGLIGGLFSRQG